MLETAKLAGFFAAHGLWCVSDGETLIPMFASEANGERQMQRLVAGRIEEGVQQGMEMLEGATEFERAVLVYDGFVTLPQGKFDALLIDARKSGESESKLLMAVPFRPKTWRKRFKVFKPKFLEISDPSNDLGQIAESFFAGVDQHEQGAKVWNAAIDQSI
ncbi:MAG: hypothetical protein H6839_10575 [Planctomycetes bacterium]|nr:hypothetical protein [Planctomycetota bacterium]